VRALLAIADLRLREVAAARLAWLVAFAFALGWAAARWARGPDLEASAALADRVCLWTAFGVAGLVAAILPALGLPGDVRTGAAQSLLAAPASRFAVVAGGVAGYALSATLLFAGMAGASTLGMQAAGLGTAERGPLRVDVVAEAAEADDTGTAMIDAAQPEAAFLFRVPRGLRDGDAVRVRFDPRGRIEDRHDRATEGVVTVRAAGAREGAASTVRFKAGAEFAATVAAEGLMAGEVAEVTFRRTSGGWKLVFPLGSVRVGCAPRLCAAGIAAAALCAAPLLLLLAAVGSFGASRFGAPTAVAFAGFVFLLVAARGLVVEGAQHVLVLARQQSAHAGESADEHAGHAHGPAETVGPARVAAARAAIAVFERMPRFEAFDGTVALIERRALGAEDVRRAAVQGLPAAALVTAAAWLLFRRREIAPG
jgi:hypothetical protein